MSAIGRYVHLMAYNYEQYGISESSKSINLSEALAAERKSILDRIKNYEKINANTLKSLENKINEMIKRLGTEKSEQLTKEEKWGKMAREFLEGELNKEFDKLQNLDWNRISVDMKENTTGIGRIRTNYTTYKKDPWRKVIVDRVNQLNLVLKQMEEGINAQDGVNPKEYSLVIDNLSKLLNETYEKTWEAISQTGAKVNKRTTQNLIKEINGLIGQYAALPDLPKQRGDMFEHVLQLVPQMAESEIDREMYETANKGTQAVKVIVDSKSFDRQVLKNRYGEVTQEINSSQNKIDVAFKWKDKQLNISAKNVDFKGEKYSYIHTLEGSSLDYLLQDENSDFVNHYLNLFSLHYGKRAKNINWDARRKEIMEVMKLLISYKALTGDTFGRKDYKTNVFIINEKSRGVRVISIAKLLKEMQNRQFGNLSVSSNIRNLYKNKKVEGPEAQRHVLKWTRISNVLQEMHSRKISASFNSSLIWQ